MKKSVFKFFAAILMLISVAVGLSLEMAPASGVYTVSEIEQTKAIAPVTLSVSRDGERVTFDYKLFDFIDIKKISGKVGEKRVYLGGRPIGLTVSADGVIVISKNAVVTENGLAFPCEDVDLKCGDVIEKVNGKTVSTFENFGLAVGDNPEAVLEVDRKGQKFSVTANPAKDALTGKYKLGLKIKEGVSGIGTLTYVTEKAGFGALGHYVIDGETGLSSQLDGGKIYKAVINGVVKGRRGAAGGLEGAFNKYDGQTGTINKNNNFGIFGNYTASLEGFEKIEVGGADSVKVGKAQIYTTVDGATPDYYDIEIIKAKAQSRPEEKSMVISVTDKRLLEKTGGIVQGMSGSPIIQNGKIIGAVTHVFVNDPTKGYGLYIGWMLGND